MHHDAMMFIMNTPLVRTTVTFPEAIHRALYEEAFARRLSFNKLVLKKILGDTPTKRRFVVKPYAIGVGKNLHRKDIYDDILNHRLAGTR